MSFKRDWLKEWERKSKLVTPHALHDPHVRYEMNLFSRFAELLRGATTIRLRGDQAQVFLETPADEGQDYVKWLRMPYPCLYIALEAPLMFKGYLGEDDAKIMYDVHRTEHQAALDLARADDVIVRAKEAVARGKRQSPAMLQMVVKELQEITAALKQLEHTRDEMEQRWAAVQEEVDRIKGEFSRDVLEYAGLLRPPGSDPAVKGILLIESLDPRHLQIGNISVEAHAPFVRVIQIVFFMPDHQDLLACHVATVGICEDNALVTSKHGFWQTREKMIGWTIHLINFLSSPSIKLVRNEPPKELQRARQRRGQEPLPGWYEITYRKHVQEYTKDKMSTKKWEHAFRYDVRGHRKVFTRGPMAGRVIWCPPHQRGLKHDLYKPKGYRMEDESGGDDGRLEGLDAR